MFDRIKALAAEKGVTIAKIESCLGLSNGIIGKWKTQDPSAHKLHLVADYLNTSVDYLLTGNSFCEDISKNEQKLLDIIRHIEDHDEQLMLIGVTDNYAKSLPSYKSQSIDGKEGRDAQQRLDKTS